MNNKYNVCLLSLNADNHYYATNLNIKKKRQVICWALLLSLPLMLPILFFQLPATFAGIGTPAWTGLAYISIFSMLVGFIFWYRGLAQGGIAAVGQLQLLQPFFGLTLAATLLHEQVSIGMVAVTVGVILCVAGSKRFAK